MPPESRSNAVGTGGLLYLGLLLAIAVTFSNSSQPIKSAYGTRAGTNLKWTVIALLLCFLAAFLFIGFIAPPFIFLASAGALVVAAFSEAKGQGDEC